MIDYFDHVTLRTKESDFLVKQLFNLRSLGWNLGKTPQQIVEHVHCANVTTRKYSVFPILFSLECRTLECQP